MSRRSDDVPLREYVEALMAEQHRAVEAALAAAEKAVVKAETAAEKRFDSVNEFRKALTDQTATFIPREVAEQRFGELRTLIDANTDRINSAAGSDTATRRAKDATDRWMIAGIGFLIVGVGIVLRLTGH